MKVCVVESAAFSSCRACVVSPDCMDLVDCMGCGACGSPAPDAPSQGYSIKNHTAASSLSQSYPVACACRAAWAAWTARTGLQRQSPRSSMLTRPLPSPSQPSWQGLFLWQTPPSTPDCYPCHSYMRPLVTADCQPTLTISGRFLKARTQVK